MTTFMVSLYCETDGSEMSVPVEYDGDTSTEDILKGNFGESFIDEVFASISIIPLHVTEDDE